MSLCGRNRVVVLILALVVGGAGGYFAHVAFRSGPAEVREPTQRVREVHPVPARRTARRPVAGSAELKELRERVMSLEAEFDEVTGAADEGRKENLPGKDAGAGGKSEDVVTSAEVRAKCKTYGDWKRQYPKHWEKDHGEFVKKATRELQKYAKWQQALSALDTSGMTEEERAVHRKLLETYAKLHELLCENMRDDDEMTLKRERDNMNEIYRLDEEGRKLMALERSTLLGIVAENLGRQLGWQSEDVVEFSDTLQAIADATAKDLQN